MNRAREGLRVLEDTARFLWNDKSLYLRLRSIRHRLSQISQSHYRDFLKSRESRRDVGRTIEEGPRASIVTVAVANMRRAQEAVRVLEEYSKVFSPPAAAAFKEIRYQLYQQEKRILTKWP